jgi:hypothetical protein
VDADRQQRSKGNRRRLEGFCTRTHSHQTVTRLNG